MMRKPRSGMYLRVVFFLDLFPKITDHLDMIPNVKPIFFGYPTVPDITHDFCMDFREYPTFLDVMIFT